MKLSKSNITEFRETIWNFYLCSGRPFAWRNIDDPYKILISEVMLQQTQTYRVIPKYEQFILEFSNFKMLASATLRDVLSIWQGLGYNRRGMYLHQLAKAVVAKHNGILPNDPVILETFPGIGKATAASICAFAFNEPAIFIETNIRTVFIHFFFEDKTEVHDKLIMPLVEKTVDKANPGEWYYALMDYGVMLKKRMPNPSRKSKHYIKQSKFEGSDRQIRGRIIRQLTVIDSITIRDLICTLEREPSRVHKIIAQLCNEQFIEKTGNKIRLKG